MFIYIVALMLGQTEPGPLDAFRANYAATRVKTEFVLEVGEADGGLIAGGALWRKDDVGFQEDEVWRVSCRWECDGRAEHVVCAPSGSVAEDAARSKRAHRPQIDPQQASIDALFDGETSAVRRLEDSNDTIRVEFGRDPPGVHQTPFLWFPPTRFPYHLVDFTRLAQHGKPVSVGAHPTELEVYRKEEGGGWEQTEVYYDSSIGYLPRYDRVIGVGKLPDGRVFCGVRDFYLIEARPCAAGGFVPTEWYVASYHFDHELPNYKAGDVIKPGSTRVGLIHYKTTRFEDMKGPVRMDHLEGVEFIRGVGGAVPVRDSPATLTLDELKFRLGHRNMTSRQRPLGPSIDLAELNESSSTKWSGTWYYYVGLALIIGVALYFFRRKGKTRLLAFLLCFPTASGCGYVGKPVVHLVAAFDRTHLVNETNAPSLSLNLLVRNEGNQPVRIFDVNGGCGCRKVDQSHLPAVLSPGDNLKLGVELQNSRSADTQHMAFNFSTDHGTLSTPVSLLVIPRHQVSPTAVTLNLLEDEVGTFELTHRAIYRTGETIPEARVVVPSVFEETNRTTTEGRLEILSGYSFRDSLYTFRLKDAQFGLRKSGILLKGDEHGTLADVAVVYRRTRFLHSAPETAYLGAAPVRVFLRCPDDSVELTRVTSTPRGVRAVVSSTNELIVKLSDDAPEMINGIVKVGTTAKTSDPELRIPVVRYSRRISGAASPPHKGRS